MDDRRIIKTKKAIDQAFITLLKEKPLNKITVAELSKKADLGRGTFYLHYKDIYDLYDHMEDKLYAELIEIFDTFSPCNTSENTLKLTQSMANYIHDEKKRFLILALPNNNGNIFNKLKKIFSQKVLGTTAHKQTSEYEQLEAIFMVSGVIGVLEDWLKSGLDMPLEQVSLSLHQLLMKFDC